MLTKCAVAGAVRRGGRAEAGARGEAWHGGGDLPQQAGRAGSLQEVPQPRARRPAHAGAA